MTRRILDLVGSAVIQGMVFLLILLTFSLNWAIKNFNGVEIDAIIFTLRMPLAGISTQAGSGYLSEAFWPAVLVFSLGVLAYIVLHICFQCSLSLVITGKKQRRLRIFPPAHPSPLVIGVLLLWIYFLFSRADGAFSVKDYITSRSQQSTFIEEEYVDPQEVSITFPEKKKNLILLYLESMESTYQDEENGGSFDVNRIPELTRLAGENVSFSQSELLEGACVAPSTSWTSGALVAQTSGLPLMITKYTGESSMDNYKYFLPGATSMGDILEEAGYDCIFMCGSDAVFGGRKNYFTQHGDFTIYDLFTAREEGIVPPGYYNGWWGFEDATLYDYAKEKLTELSETGKPFCLSLLTVDTHNAGGYVCAKCPEVFEEQYDNVLACASRQAYDFIEWIKEQDFFEDTTIVISGDHSYTYRASDAMSDKVYNAIVNPAVEPVREKNRRFTTLDMFPTALASIGVEIEGDRLGLGTNLFSAEPTLAERYGYEAMFSELNRDSSFYRTEFLYPSL